MTGKTTIQQLCGLKAKMAVIAAGSAFVSMSASGNVIFSQDFNSFDLANGLQVPGWTNFGGFSSNPDPNVLDGGTTTNGTNSAFFDANGTGFETDTSIVVDTGVAIDGTLDYTLTFDMFKVTPDLPAFEGDFIASLWVGEPGVTVGTFPTGGPDTTVNDNGGAAALLASSTFGGTIEGTGLSVSSLAPGVAGNLFLSFEISSPINTTGFAQVELDNVSVQAVPEPASLWLAAAGSLVLLKRRRSVS